MDKYTIRILALALLSLHLVCSSTLAQGRIVGDMDNEKINFPSGLCFYDRHCEQDMCYCCMVNEMCYNTNKECMRQCEKAKVATRTPPPFLA
ncbi:unnamed protein product [Alopecurus aequalis]